ncbi:hypothetical protein EMIT0180MI3_50054 [Priestia megaterium]
MNTFMSGSYPKKSGNDINKRKLFFSLKMIVYNVCNKGKESRL